MSLAMWDSNTAAVAQLQTALKNAGFDPGAIDGIYGPQTSSAVAAYQAANGLPADGIFGPQTEATLYGAGAPTAGASAQDIIRTVYPQIAWAYNIPEVKAIIDQAAAEHWDPGRIQGAIEATTWWQNTAASARLWQQLQAEDPAQAQARRDQTAASLSDQAGQLGLALSSARLNELVNTALSTGATQAQITDMLVAEAMSSGTGSGSIQANINMLRGAAADYAVPISDQTLSQWAGQIAGGSTTAAAFQTYLVEQAKSLFPTLSTALDSGITVAQYTEPYKQIAQQELGMNPADFNLLDGKWSRAINSVDSTTGERASMSLYDWISTIRSDPSYGYDKTPGAVNAAIELSTQLQKAFGTIG